jgi:hypothetical protein
MKKDGADQTIRLRNGRRLGYAEWGDPGGRPLLYIHGWPGSRVEGRLADEAAKATGVRLIAVEMHLDLVALTVAIGRGGQPGTARKLFRLDFPPRQLTAAGPALGFDVSADGSTAVLMASAAAPQASAARLTGAPRAANSGNRAPRQPPA